MNTIGSYVVALTGASGAIYGIRLVQALLDRGHDVYLLITDPGRRVLQVELGWVIDGDMPAQEAAVLRHFGMPPGSRLSYLDYQDTAAKIASGSIKTDGMVVIPCTMATAAGIAHGTLHNLVGRAADVHLKEKRPLLLVPRETPLNQVHLKNLLLLAELGAMVVPAMPAFYHQPRDVLDLVDFLVGRVLDLLGIDHNLYQPWKEEGQEGTALLRANYGPINRIGGKGDDRS